MDSTLTIVLILLLGLALGATAGWFFGSRTAADLQARLAAKEIENVDLDAKLLAVIEERATHAARSASLAEQMSAQAADRESLKTEFEAAGAKVLANAQEAFLSRAHDRFSQSEKNNEERIRALLQPVSTNIAKHEAQVEKMEKDRVEGFSKLDGLLQAESSMNSEITRQPVCRA